MDGASTSVNRPKRKGCGRRRIEIKKIEDQRKSWVAFSKRKKGLFKKAAQLSSLTGERIAVVIISEQGRVYTSDNADSVIAQFLSIKDDHPIQADGDDSNGTGMIMDVYRDNGKQQGKLVLHEKEQGKLVQDDEGGNMLNQPVGCKKINNGNLRLKEVKEDREVLHDHRLNAATRLNQPVGFEKINNGNLSLKEVKETGEVSQDYRLNATERLRKLRGDNCLFLFDLNKTPDEQFP